MIRVRVPATSANMGPGFDSMGIALDLYNDFFIQEIQEGLNISGCPIEDCHEGNLLYQSMVSCFEMLGYPYKGFNIRFDSRIPISRGLGSSASCILGGVLAANKIAGEPLDKPSMLGIASKMEGHPDNIAPALFGGLVISITEGDDIYYNKIEIPPGIKFCALIPDFTLSTREARAVLPKTIPYQDAVFNISRSSLFVSALIKGDYALIKQACQDRLHQPYRGTLIPDYDEIMGQCQELNSLAVYLSGAGPTIMAILREEDHSFIPNIKDYVKSLSHQWEVIPLREDAMGARVTSL